MSNKTLAILPITTILLSGAKAGLPIQPPVGNDRLEYALISSGLKGYETNISLLASFSTKSKVNEVEVYKIKPVNLEYLLVTSLSAGNNISISTQVNVIEPYTKEEYNKVGLSGPRFKIVVTSTVGTIKKSSPMNLI